MSVPTHLRQRWPIDSATGEWTYTLDNSLAATQGLNDGTASPQLYTATVTDENGATDTQDVTITITGTNDAPGITSTTGAAVRRRGDRDRPGGRRHHSCDRTGERDRHATADGCRHRRDRDAGRGAFRVRRTYGTMAIDRPPASGPTRSTTACGDQGLSEGDSDTSSTPPRHRRQRRHRHPDCHHHHHRHQRRPGITATTGAAVEARHRGRPGGRRHHSCDRTGERDRHATATDVNTGETRDAGVEHSGPTTYGTMAIDSATGEWTYTLDNTGGDAGPQRGRQRPQLYTATVTDDTARPTPRPSPSPSPAPTTPRTSPRPPAPRLKAQSPKPAWRPTTPQL